MKLAIPLLLTSSSTMFGSHDSAAWFLNTTSSVYNVGHIAHELLVIAQECMYIPIGSIAKKWGQTQSLNMTQQIDRGVKYLDLRVMQVDDMWYTCHGLLGYDLNKTIDQIQRATATRSDNVIIEVSSYTPIDETLCSAFDGLVDTYYVIGQCTNMISSQVIHNTFAGTPDLDTMVEYNKQQVIEFSSGKFSNKLFKLSWTLTPNLSTILKSMLLYNTLYELAKTARNAWPDFEKWCFRKNLTLPDIVIFDYIELYL